MKEGDRIYKARPYNDEDYCRHGGDEYDVPIGTQGKIIEADPHNKETVRVAFDNGVNWSVNIIEIELCSPTKIPSWRGEME